jgi:cytochrome P450
MAVSAPPAKGQPLAAAVGDLLSGRDPRWRRDPYPLYERLRNEDPVFQYQPKIVLISRYSDIKAVRLSTEIVAPRELVVKHESRAARLSEEELALYEEIVEFMALMLSRHDGERHREYRNALQRAFIPKQVAQWPAMVQAIVDEEIARLPRDGVIDLISFAFRVPLLVIMALMGAPVEDADRVKHWGDGIIESMSVVPLDPALIRSGARRIREYREYARAMIRKLREDASGPQSSVIALLLGAEESERLSYDEIVATFMHFLFAGHETTTNLIGNGALCMLSDRGQWELFSSDPGRYAPDAVEESLRYEAPTQITPRESAARVEIGGVVIGPGVSIQMVNAAANRDPEAFAEPDRFDITRGRSDHMALGLGRHYCLGAPLARLEGVIALETLARRFPDLELAGDPAALEWRPQPRLRGLTSLPVRLGRDRG